MDYHLTARYFRTPCAGVDDALTQGRYETTVGAPELDTLFLAFVIVHGGEDNLAVVVGHGRALAKRDGQKRVPILVLSMFFLFPESQVESAQGRQHGRRIRFARLATAGSFLDDFIVMFQCHIGRLLNR